MTRYTDLFYAVRWRVLGRYLGELGIALSALLAVPGGVSLAFGEGSAGMRYLVVSFLLLGSGIAALRLPAEEELQANEALVIVGAAFVLAPLLVVWPVSASGLDFVDSLFEAVSGVTTTGLSVVESVDRLPPSLLFARAWLQWIGGLGFVVLGGALLLRPGTAAKRLLGAELHLDDRVGGTRARARRILLLYSGITFLGVLLLWLCGASIFESVVTTLASVSTGGFATHDQSAAALPLGVRVAALLLFLIGASPLALWWPVRSRGWRALVRDRQLMALLSACVGVSLLLVPWMGSAGRGWTERVGHALFMGFSAQTTTGFSTLDPAGLEPAPKLILVLAMFVGGSVGSTAGGVKLLRMLVLLRVAQLFLIRTALPQHAVLEPHLGARRLEQSEVRDCLLMILMFAMVIVLVWLPFLGAGLDPLDALFDVVSATGTVGLSTGVVAPDLSPGLKLLLCVSMVLGRLELIAVLVLLYPRTWLGRRRRG